MHQLCSYRQRTRCYPAVRGGRAQGAALNASSQHRAPLSRAQEQAIGEQRVVCSGRGRWYLSLYLLYFRTYIRSVDLAEQRHGALHAVLKTIVASHN